MSIRECCSLFSLFRVFRRVSESKLSSWQDLWF